MRSSRLLSILILMQVHGRVTATQLSREFEVSERTIYRDMDALSAAGIPLYGDSGHGGGYFLLDGYQTRLTGLNAAEAGALPVIGVAQAAAALGLSEAARSARSKIWAALPPAHKSHAIRVADRLHIDMVDWYRSHEILDHLPLVAQAVLGDRFVEMRYESWRTARHWRVAPYGLVMKAGHWYLVAGTSDKTRIFRLSNMLAVRICTETFDCPTDFALAAWWTAENERFEQSLFCETATLLVTPVGMKRLASLSPRGAAAAHRAKPRKDGWLHTEMAVENSDHGARELLGLGAEVQIVAPLDLRTLVHGLARDIAALHCGDPEGASMAPAAPTCAATNIG
jgi:predicted DNA-binding transcriptional regulator YafY